MASPWQPSSAFPRQQASWTSPPARWFSAYRPPWPRAPLRGAPHVTPLFRRSFCSFRRLAFTFAHITFCSSQSPHPQPEPPSPALNSERLPATRLHLDSSRYTAPSHPRRGNSSPWTSSPPLAMRPAPGSSPLIRSPPQRPPTLSFNHHGPPPIAPGANSPVRTLSCYSPRTRWQKPPSVGQSKIRRRASPSYHMRLRPHGG